MYTNDPKWSAFLRTGIGFLFIKLLKIKETEMFIHFIWCWRSIEYITSKNQRRQQIRPMMIHWPSTMKMIKAWKAFEIIRNHKSRSTFHSLSHNMDFGAVFFGTGWHGTWQTYVASVHSIVQKKNNEGEMWMYMGLTTFKL